LINRLRQNHYQVQVACDPDQTSWWLGAGEKNLVTPRTVSELLAVVDRAGAFIGNDSGPGHVAAFCGVPSFILFGSGLPEWFAPLPLVSHCVEGKPCPYKPCFDYCRFPVPQCLWNVTLDEVWTELQLFLKAKGPAIKAYSQGSAPQESLSKVEAAASQGL
jgi:heptosyltransferase-2